jgi:mRNA-degrading endonuclease RelE of RelBE toxin-antitoxin system
MKVEIEISACNFVKELPLKSRRIILKQLRRLEDLFQASEIEKIGNDVYRLYIGRTYTVFFMIYPEHDLVRVTDILPIGIAHKRYNRFI